ncbi:MAG: AAA family ATPase [Thermoguttaceae bacterium]
MKITSFEIERFGLWSGLSVPKLSPGINVFYGANEAGKSTLLEFVRAQFYGFGHERKRFARRPGNANVGWNSDVDHDGNSLFVVSGGRIELESPSGEYKLVRFFRPSHAGNEEQVELRTKNGEKEATQLLRVLLTGVDESTFNNVFAIGLDELQKLGSLSDTEAAEMLFRLSVGMDRISIVEAIKELTSRRNRILNVTEKDGASASLLPQLLRDREKINEEISSSKLMVRDYIRIRGEQRGIDRTVEAFESELNSLQKEQRLYEIAQLAEPIWRRRQKLHDEIDAMGQVVVVADDVIVQLDSLIGEMGERKSAFEKLQEETEKVRKSIETLPINETLIRLAPKLEILLEEETRILELDGQITGIEQEVTALETQIAEEESQIKRGRRTLQMSERIQTMPKLAIKSATKSDVREVSEVSSNSFGQINEANGIETHAASQSERASKYASKSDSFDAERLENYRLPAKRVHHARQKLIQTKERHVEILGRSKILNEKIKSELSKRNEKDLMEAVEKASDLTSQLHRRQELGLRFTEMASQHKELRRINAFLVQNQALPVWALIGAVLVGMLGAIPIGLEFFKMLGFEVFETPPILAIFGLAGIVGAISFKVITEKNNSRRLQFNQHKLGLLGSQIEQVKQEIAAIDAKQSAHFGAPVPGTLTAATTANSVDIRYHEAKQDLEYLEKLIPIDAQRREVSQQLKQIESRLNQYKHKLESATKRWSDWLKNAGLPNDWTPARIRDLLEHCDVVGDLKKELDLKYEIMNQRIRDMRQITDRIDRMIFETGLHFADGLSYIDILSEIRKKLAENESALKQRDKLKEGLKQFAKMRKKVIGDLRRTKRNLLTLLGTFGANKPQILRDLQQRHIKHRKLLQQEQSVQRELDAALAGFCKEETISKFYQVNFSEQKEDELSTSASKLRSQNVSNSGFSHNSHQSHVNTQDSLETLIQNVTKKIDVVSTKLRAELEQRGQLTEQLKQLAEDQTIIKKQRELSIIEEKIARARTEWQSYAVCARMLDGIRATYERERQPRTLAEASELLRRLTSDKYHRIWTPLGEETLLVDDADGNTFNVAWISRGTREQLFIALRLALASAFAQHGSILPLILDDVLVNFDSKRSFAAAQVLLDFANSGRQIFLLTCHEHVCRMFQKLDVPVRILPPVDAPDSTPKVLLPISILKKRIAEKKARIKRRRERLLQQKLNGAIAKREQTIRQEAIRHTEVQHLIVQIQQQATAEKMFEAEKKSVQEQTTLGLGQTVSPQKTHNSPPLNNR